MVSASTNAQVCPDPIRVLIVDDHEAVRAGLSSLIQETADLEVVGSDACGEAAVHVVHGTRPDVAVVDYRLKGRDGAWVCRELVRRRPSLRVLILTSYVDEAILL